VRYHIQSCPIDIYRRHFTDIRRAIDHLDRIKDHIDSMGHMGLFKIEGNTA
jgi:hypothetical protein